MAELAAAPGRTAHPAQPPCARAAEGAGGAAVQREATEHCVSGSAPGHSPFASHSPSTEALIPGPDDATPTQKRVGTQREVSP